MLDEIDRKMTWRLLLGVFLLDIFLSILGFDVPDILEEILLFLFLLRVYLDIKRSWYKNKQEHITPRIELIFPIRAVFILFTIYYWINKLPASLMNLGLIAMLGYVAYLIFYESRYWFN